MTTCTPVYGLPCIDGGDAPCEQSATWCDFATIVEANLDRLDAVADRAIDSIPMAQVRLTVASSQAASPTGSAVYVSFDTVDVDTDNMVDLTANPFVITLPSFGRYFAYFSIQAATTGTANINIIAAVATPTGTALETVDQYSDDLSNPFYMSGSGSFRYQSPTGGANQTTTSNQILLNVNTTAAIPLQAVTFGVYWLGDLP
jgi:hypothetical protein